MSKTMQCDYLVVGGGAAGCIVARRLAERADNHVILTEAGRSDEGDPVAMELARLDEQDESYDWGYLAQPTSTSTQPMFYNRAKMLGGCANHNDCAFLFPPASDFDRWVELGAEGWSYGDIVPAMLRVEAQLNIVPTPEGTELSRAFIDANLELGKPEVCFREHIVEGAGWFPLNVKGPIRQSSSIAYLHPIEQLPDNLEVVTETLVTRLKLNEGRVIGVETEHGSIDARREVILCAGSINSPQLLVVSGIGPGQELQRLGIPIEVDLPGIGQNLEDHAGVNIAAELHESSPAWELTPCEAVALLQIDADAPAPDVLTHFVLTLRDKYTEARHFGEVEHGFKISPNVTRPKSRGRLSWNGVDIHSQPKIELNYFSDAEGYDARIMLGALRFGRQLLETSALAPWIKRTILPEPGIETDDELLAFARETCETVYHPTSTCRMGSVEDPMTVVTPDLKVKGIDGLRVADASVFPGMVTVNICNTVMMLAERAAELIANDLD